MPEHTSSPPGAETGAEDGFASALIRARSELGLTQAQVADLSGISRSAIKGYESGRNMPGARELRALCRVLKVSPTVLLYGSDAAFQEIVGGELEREGFDHMRARWQLLALARLLPVDEVEAVLKLLRAIAVARHGVDFVNSSLEAGSGAALALTGPERAKTAKSLGAFVAALDQQEGASAKDLAGDATQKDTKKKS
jgi:transcriptional regulator with XRE-family HTH domain